MSLPLVQLTPRPGLNDHEKQRLGEFVRRFTGRSMWLDVGPHAERLLTAYWQVLHELPPRDSWVIQEIIRRLTFGPDTPMDRRLLVMLHASGVTPGIQTADEVSARGQEQTA